MKIEQRFDENNELVGQDLGDAERWGRRGTAKRLYVDDRGLAAQVVKESERVKSKWKGVFDALC